MLRFRFAALAILTTLAFAVLAPVAAHSAQAAPGDLCFKETGQCINGRFREYWERNGGLAVFGFPITAARNERNRDTGQSYLTQWFERNRFELHPENKAPYDVLLGRLGDDRLTQFGVNWKKEGRASQQNGCLFFAETGHNVCDQANGLGFKTYWSTHGLEFDGKRGVSFPESLALFGLPLTEPRMEINTSGDRVLTQWFERARFEWHPAQRDPAFRVLLGRLSSEVRNPQTAYRLPTNVPWVYQDNKVVALTNGAPQFDVPRSDPNNQPAEIQVAPNGKLLSYTERTASGEQYLVVLYLESGYKRVLPVASNGIILGGMWSPDSRQYMYTVIYQSRDTRYELRLFDVESSAVAIRRNETANNVPLPLLWNASGAYLTNIIFASDAPSSDILKVDPQTGRLETLAQGPHYGTAISADGRKIAMVTGEYPLGEAPKLALTVLDRTTGRTQTIVPQAAQYISSLRWSPDGTKLVHVRTAINDTQASGIYVTNPDGSGEQMLRLDSGAFPGALEDVAWRNNGALLVMTQDGPRNLSVFEVPLSNFHPAQAKTLQTIGRDSDFWGIFVYVPR
ncbi:MAG: hypothetical protein M3R24_08525 [Chloroflexota bacterium]|nr:hypothetical protein [Chloroflexota bacterium]